jgi:hypothetical protein
MLLTMDALPVHPQLQLGEANFMEELLDRPSAQVDNYQPHIQAWSVPCILIIGSLPDGRDKKRSFEIYRGSQRDVLIITLDEFLAKLMALHEFLISKPDRSNEGR